MAVAHALSRAQFGLDAPLVDVEVHVGAGLPGFGIVGLPAPVVRESRERVRAAIFNSGYEFPPGRITVNLAPVELSKEGGRFDLPIAIGLLAASGQLPADPARLAETECFGELGLQGELKTVSGIFLAALHAGRAGHALLVPASNRYEALRAGCSRTAGAVDLRSACEALTASAAYAGSMANDAAHADADSGGDAPLAEGLPVEPTLGDVVGQAPIKRALLVAAAGGHSLLMLGPPGSGKSLLAACLPGLLPELSDTEALEVASIASIADTRHAPPWGRRPFRSPHHTSSAHAIVGGGPQARPGEITLAHRGVLFLDELPEFDRRVLESLREPLETGRVCVARAARRLELPAQFQLVAAMNPCPCGYQGDAARACTCGPRRIERYRARISGPLLDRIDLRVEVPRVDRSELLRAVSMERTAACTATRPEDESRVARAQVCTAWRRQLARAPCLNARLPAGSLPATCALEPAAEQVLKHSLEKLALSARGVHRLLRVARTLADLEERERIGPQQIAEAIQMRRVLD